MKRRFRIIEINTTHGAAYCIQEKRRMGLGWRTWDRGFEGRRGVTHEFPSADSARAYVHGICAMSAQILAEWKSRRDFVGVVQQWDETA